MIFAARLGVLLVGLVAVGALVHGQRPAGPEAAHYACPMHPEVVAGAPAQCPACGMALTLTGVPGTRAVAGALPPGAVEVPEVRGPPPIQAGRFLSYGTAPVHRRALAATTESAAWLDAQGAVVAVLFEDEVRDLDREERGVFVAARAPGVALAVERDAGPPVHWRGSMWRVRFRFRSGGPPKGLRVGATGWLQRPSAGRGALVVLSSAVLQASTGPSLLTLAADRRTYRSQPITTGRVASGYTVVVSGAGERDLVFGHHVFSLGAHLQTQRRRQE